MNNPAQDAQWQSSNYLLLSTQKRDGSWVDTPVWYAHAQYQSKACFYLFSEGKAGKVKRIRNFKDVKVQSCTVTGKPTGQWQNAKAELLDKQAEQLAHQALIKQYGWQMRLLDLGSRLAGKINKRAFIRISFDESN